MEENSTCLVCDRYDDVAVSVNDLNEPEKVTLSLFLEIECHSDDILCFGCHGKLTISTSFLKMCRSSEKCLTRKKQEVESRVKDELTREDIQDVELMNDTDECEAMYLEEFIEEEVLNDTEEAEEAFEEISHEPEKDDVKMHVENMCEFCGKTFTTQRSYRVHKLLKHSNEKTDSSHTTKNKFENINDRLTHEKTHLNESHPYKCGECGEKFTTRTLLRDHYESHSNLIWPCTYEGCDKTFRTRHGRWTHEYKHKNESKACHLCGKILKTTWSINQHIKFVHTKSDERHECGTCEKAFKNRKTLLNHMRIHNQNKKTQECDICQRKFFSKHNLTRHWNQVHSAIKPFACTYDNCKFATGSNYNLNRHVLTHQKHSENAE